MSNLCPYFSACRGCTLWEEPYDQQKAKKIRILKDKLALHGLTDRAEIDWITSGTHGLRHRADFSFNYDTEKQKTNYGFFDENRRIVPIHNCLQLSPELQLVFSEFVSIPIQVKNRPIERGSVRLRIGPSGQKGCWLDLANRDIKDLLDDGVFLRQLMQMGFIVEMGQKNKRVVERDKALKFSEATPATWFKTLETPLQCSIADFTQPSWLTADQLTETALNWLSDFQVSSSKKLTLLEFGAGIGQFTLPFLKAGIQVQTLEIEESATTHLQLNAQLAGLTEKLKTHVGNFHQIQSEFKCDVAFVNPARSGLKGFTETLIKSEALHLIYISCFADSMCEDLKKMSSHYQIEQIKIVDQFPQTDHFETCVRLKKLNR